MKICSSPHSICKGERQALLEDRARGDFKSMNGLTNKLGRDGGGFNPPDRPIRKGCPLSLPLSIKGGCMSWRERDIELTRKAGSWILSSLNRPKKATISMFLVVVVVTIVLTALFMVSMSWAQDMKASWYSEWALKRDGQWDITHGRTANGQLFADHKLTAASWKYFGKTVKITRTDTKASVVVLVNDKTARRFAETRIDLSPAAFSRLASLGEGVVPVTVEVI